MRGLVAKARAMARRCRCPPDRSARARLDHRVVVPCGSCEDELIGAGQPWPLGRRRRAACPDACHRYIFMDGLIEQEIFLQHDAELAAQPRRIELHDVDAVQQYFARTWRVEALQKLGSASTFPSLTVRTMPITSPGRISGSEILLSALGRSGR